MFYETNDALETGTNGRTASSLDPDDASFNAGANHVAEIAFSEKTANKFALQKLVYGELRTTYKLPAQLAIRAISKANEAYKGEQLGLLSTPVLPLL